MESILRQAMDMDNPHESGENGNKIPLQMKIIERGCPELQELNFLRRKGREDETLKLQLDKHFEKKRNKTDNSTKKDDKNWGNTYAKIMAALIKETECLDDSTKIENFLDLGCCPGGFSRCILEKFPEAKGVGVSLRVADGGNSLTIRVPRSRFEVHWGDLTYFDICAPVSTPAEARSRLVQTPAFYGGFQLAILDGHHSRRQESDDTHPWDIDRLLISQLIIALEVLASEGTLIITLKRVEWAKTARILYMLDKLSTTADVFKQSGPHQTRSTFYAIARGVGQGQEGHDREFYVQKLKDLWLDLTFGGPVGKGRWIEQHDLDFIIDMEDLETTYLDRLIHFGRTTWIVQSNGLKVLYKQMEESE